MKGFGSYFRHRSLVERGLPVLHHFQEYHHALSGNRPEGAFCCLALYWRALARLPAAPTCGLANLHSRPARPHFSPILYVLSNTCGLSSHDGKRRVHEALRPDGHPRRHGCESARQIPVWTDTMPSLRGERRQRPVVTHVSRHLRPCLDKQV